MMHPYSHSKQKVYHRQEDVPGSGVIAPSFLTLALDGGEWHVSPPDLFTTGERTLGIHWIEGLQNRYGRYGVEKNLLPLPGVEPWSSNT
jgi:hypothetical protein